MLYALYIMYIYIYILYAYTHIYTHIYSRTQIRAVTWRIVHEHIVADTFCSKKSSSALLVHE